MKIKKGSHVDGLYFELIPGQPRYYYAQSDFEEFYDITEWLKQNGGYQGSTLHFFDLETGVTFVPFPKERNVVYGKPIFCNDYLYFLRGDFNRHTMTLYQYLPDKILSPVFNQEIDKFNLYNLHLTGTPVHIISQDKKITCYYPEPFECPMALNESLIFIEDGRLYFSAWIEEGIENNIATDHYKYYKKLIIKDLHGNILSEEVGCLSQFPDGNWWLL